MERWMYVLEGLKMLAILLAVVFTVFIMIAILYQSEPLFSDKFRIPKEWKKERERIDAEIEKQLGRR